MDLLRVNGHLHPASCSTGVAAIRAEPKPAWERQHRPFRGAAGGFTVAGAEGGPFLKETLVGRGLALGDLDDDGDLDGIVSTNDHDARLFVRAGRPVRRWIGFALAYEGKNPDAIGARVDVTAGGKRQRQEIRGAQSFASWQDLRLLFGLADQALAESVVVRWPRGELEEFGPLPAGSYHRLVRGKGKPAR
jgi:hypothetical protein